MTRFYSLLLFLQDILRGFLYRLLFRGAIQRRACRMAMQFLSYIPHGSRVLDIGTGTGDMAGELAILGVGFGLVIAPIGTAVINAAPSDQRGIAASLVIVLRLIGMSVGLSSLTAWGLYRFGVLRQEIVLPPIDDPGFQTAIIDGLTKTTVAVLAETFIISAAIAIIAIFAAMRLRPDQE